MKGALLARDPGLADYNSETDHAADLWRRLHGAWLALPEANEDGESPLLDGISALVDEWEAFVGRPTARAEGGRS